MSLVGNLEDLGLGDILQIVSLSRKSGMLSLDSRDREGLIVFRDGQVIRATSSVLRENVGDLLLRHGLVTLDTLKKAVFIQRNSERPPRLGTILAEKFGVPRDRIEALVKDHIEKIVYSFFTWNEGTFAFELGEPEELAATNFNPLQFMLDQGLNPQWLAMEGSRRLDEKRHRGESMEEVSETVVDVESLLGPTVSGRGAQTPASAEAALELPVTAADACDDGPLLLVDDDELIRNRLAAVLGERGLKVRAFASARECLAALEDLANAPPEPVLLIDLIMPRMDGGGMLGGLELADRVRKRFPGLALFMISDHANPEAERQARGLGVREVFGKPRHEQLARPDGAQALADLADRLVAHCRPGDGPAEDSADGHYNLGAELFRELGVAEAPGARVNATPGLHLLRGMLQELNDPGLGGGTILLVLRFASELMNRAVVFFVKDREIVGLGQFGLEIDGRSADALVRRIRIPLDRESILRSALEAKGPLRTDPGDSELDDYLFRQLGDRRPREVFLGPILSEGKVVAILYGDNLPEEKAIGDTETLEIFLSQAGLAMEKALLERRLRGRSED